VLEETRSLQLQSIPDALLADAQAVAVVPGVVKLGFVVAGRHGRGLVLTREASGQWAPSTFIELTGGGIGWQAGVQRADVVLVFKSRRALDDLFQGKKLTLGADAAVAAGPVGRQASAATDEQLKAEVYSYSRSRGLFAGVSLEGTILSIDVAANSEFAQGGGAAQADTARLVQALDQIRTSPPAGVNPAKPGELVDGTRNSLAESLTRLLPLLPATWREYLQAPPELLAGTATVAQVEATMERYDRVAADPAYEELTATEQFQTTHQLLGSYLAQLRENSTLSLPAPPVK
jgi:lipid-binding SYLF domain-containing protein